MILSLYYNELGQKMPPLAISCHVVSGICILELTKRIKCRCQKNLSFKLQTFRIYKIIIGYISNNDRKNRAYLTL